MVIIAVLVALRLDVPFLKLRKVILLRWISVIGHRAADKIVLHHSTMLLPVLEVGTRDFLLDKDIVVEPGIAVLDRHKSGHFRPVRYVVRRITAGLLVHGAIVRAKADISEGAGDQVVDKCNTFRTDPGRAAGQQQVVVNECRSVRNLDEDVFAKAKERSDLNTFRRSVVMEQVLCHACALSLPVKPQAACAVMDVVPAVNDIDRGMHLDTTDFRSGQILLVVDMMDVVVLNE